MPHDQPEITADGTPILRHTQRNDWQYPANSGESAEEIDAHIEKHLGTVDLVFHEVMSDHIHLDVHLVSSTEDFPFVRLVTSGMSDSPMNTEDAPSADQYAELMITLPGDWKLEQAQLKDENNYWPIRLIKDLARLPHLYNTWLGVGHTIPNGDPAEPYASGVQFSGAMIVPPLSAPEEFRQLMLPGGKTIVFYSVVPLYTEEMDLKLSKGLEALFDRLDKYDIGDIVDPNRRNVAKKRFGMF